MCVFLFFSLMVFFGRVGCDLFCGVVVMFFVGFVLWCDVFVLFVSHICAPPSPRLKLETTSVPSSPPLPPMKHET